MKSQEIIDLIAAGENSSVEFKLDTIRPEQLAKGIDPCIEKAVEVLLKQLQENPVKKVNTPAPPDRSGWNEQMK